MEPCPENYMRNATNAKYTQDAVSTYARLFCQICTMHMCPFHSVSNGRRSADIQNQEVPPTLCDESTPYPENEPCGEECYLNSVTLNSKLTDKAWRYPSINRRPRSMD